MSTVVFHLPYLRKDSRVDASIARPTQLIEAFKERGFLVIEISGVPGERREAIRDLRRRLRAGLKVDLFYSESHALPNALANWKSARVLQSPFLDARLFRLMRQHGVPTALFLRDVAWRSPGFMSHRPRWVRAVAKQIYWIDLVQYRRWIDLLYVPSEPMAALVPIYPQDRMKVLRAAGPRTELEGIAPPSAGRLKLVYVGNVDADVYRFHRLLTAVRQASDVAELVVNVPEISWERFRSQYEQLLGPNITVEHRSLDTLPPLLAASDIGVLFYEPSMYRTIAFPAKVLEYCAYGLPIITSGDSYAAEYIEDFGLGWVVDYDEQALRDLLIDLSAAPDDVAEHARVALAHSRGETWLNRVDQIAANLSEITGSELHQG